MDKDALLAFDIMLAPFAIAAIPFTLPLYAIKVALFGQSDDATDFFRMFATSRLPSRTAMIMKLPQTLESQKFSIVISFYVFISFFCLSIFYNITATLSSRSSIISYKILLLMSKDITQYKQILAYFYTQKVGPIRDLLSYKLLFNLSIGTPSNSCLPHFGHTSPMIPT